MPLWMSAPSVFLGCAPVSQLAPARAWSPGPSPKASPLCCSRPVRTSNLSRNASIGCSVLVNSKAAPSAAGVQSFMMMPLGVYRNAIRGTAVRLGAANAGVIESSTGRAMAAPKPCRKVRRARDRLVMNILAILLGSPPHLKWYAIHHPQNQRGKSLVIGCHFAPDLTQRGLVVILQTAS